MKNSKISMFRVLLLLLLCMPAALYAQLTAIQRAALGNQEFRWGVGSLNAGQYTEAIISFTRALSFFDDTSRARTWLGHAYYASGYNDAALEQWVVLNNTQRSALITGLIDTLSIRKQSMLPSEQQLRYIDVARINGNKGERLHRPSAVHTNSDGTWYVASMGSNRVLHLAASGTILGEYSGGLNSLQTPFDLTAYKNYLFITEITQDTATRIDTLTRQTIRFGSPGSGDGEFHGPQYITADDEGNVYISDWGNKRISKHALDGSFLFSFGNEAIGDFLGLKEPTGINYHDGIIYVADRLSTGLYTFDTSGNYREFIDFNLGEIESIEFVGQGAMLLVQRDRIFWVDVQTKQIQRIIGERAALGLTAVGIDANDHVVAVDPEKNEITAYAPFSDSAGGMFTRIEQVRASEFPYLSVLLRIEDTLGNPIMGLAKENIFLFEEGRQVSQFNIESASYMHKNSDMAVLVQPNRYQPSVEQQLVQGIKRHLIDNQAIAVQEITWAAETLLPLSLSSDDTFSGTMPVSPWKVDQALRIVGNTLIQSGAVRRGIVLVTPGALGEGEHFANVSISATARFLRNNGIQLHLLHVSNQALSTELEYLARESGGSIVREKPIREGIQEIAISQADAATGLYILRYRSDIVQEEPVQFVPIGAEIEYFVRSSRAEGGFFLAQ